MATDMKYEGPTVPSASIDSFDGYDQQYTDFVNWMKKKHFKPQTKKVTQKKKRRRKLARAARQRNRRK